MGGMETETAGLRDGGRLKDIRLLAAGDGQSQPPLDWPTQAPYLLAFLGSAARGCFFVPA
jgi:hypothetical protein